MMATTIGRAAVFTDTAGRASRRRRRRQKRQDQRGVSGAACAPSFSGRASGMLPLALAARTRGIHEGQRRMNKDELTSWALKSGWQMIGGHLSLTKPSSPKEAI